MIAVHWTLWQLFLLTLASCWPCLLLLLIPLAYIIWGVFFYRRMRQQQRQELPNGDDRDESGQGSSAG
jgi:hypothetical protein